MVDPFATGLATLHGGVGSVAAVYIQPGCDPIALRVIREQGEREAGSALGRVMRDVNAVQIRRADVAQPRDGAMLTIGAEAFMIQGGAALDSEGLTWTCYLEPA